MKIRFIPFEEIDKTKWNSCVHYATNGNIFGYEWYLKNTAKEWDALVENDYESVMPLIRRSEGSKNTAIYLPSLVRSAGIYSINVLSPKRVKAFLEAIPTNYQDITISMNTGTSIPDETGFETKNLFNNILVFNSDYETLSAKYDAPFKALLEQASQSRIMPSSGIKPEKLADFYRLHTKQYRGLEDRYHAALRIMYNSLHRGWGFASAIQNQEGKLLAACFFINSHGRLMSLLPSQSPEGAKKGALALLVDLIIRNNASRPVLLDFNSPGSDWPETLLDGIDAQEIYYTQLEKRRKRKWYEMPFGR